MKVAFAALLAFLACDALADTELAIIVAVPESVQEMDLYYDVCGDEPCLAHGYTIIQVDLNVIDGLLGPLAKGSMTVEATNGYLFQFQPRRRSVHNRHLFVLRRLHEDGRPRYVVAEADPFFDRKACTVFPLEDYLSNALSWSIAVPFFDAENCYTVDQITKLVNGRAVEPTLMP